MHKGITDKFSASTRNQSGGLALNENSFNVIFTTFLFLLALLPAVYLRYLPFHTILTPKVRRRLLRGYAVIFFAELVISLLLLFFGVLSYSFYTFKSFYIFCGFLPYFLLNLCLIRPYVAQHIFILGMQFILSATVSTVAILLVLIFTGESAFFDYFSSYCALNLTIYLTVLPIVRPFFEQIFLRFSTISTDRFWVYICPLPLLMLIHDIYFSASAEIFAVRHLFPRILLLVSGVLIALTAWRGLEYILRQAATTERNLMLLTRINSIGEYTRTLQDKQARLAIVRHDLRHNAQMLADLISRGEEDAAMQLVKNMNAQIDATRVEHFAGNPLIDAALSVYVRQARQKDIAVEIKVDIPASFAAEVDLSLVLCNLFENAIHAEEDEPPSQRAIRILSRTKGASLFFSIENRTSAPVPLNADGLPESRDCLPDHGHGTRSLLLFAEKYGAEFFTKQKDGWFSVLLHVPAVERMER